MVDGIVGPWMLDHMRDAARRSPEVPLDYVVLRPAREVALARAQARTAPDALVDAVPILAMWDQFADLGAFERHVLDTTDRTAAATVDAVRTAVDGGRLRWESAPATPGECPPLHRSSTVSRLVQGRSRS